MSECPGLCDLAGHNATGILVISLAKSCSLTSVNCGCLCVSDDLSLHALGYYLYAEDHKVFLCG